MDELRTDTFSQEIRMREMQAHNGYCRVKGCLKKIHSFHHRIPNTRYNRERFPLLIQHQFNCAGVCDEHHINHKSVACLDISQEEAQIYEQALKEMLTTNKQEE